MTDGKTLHTRLGHSDASHIEVRGLDLCNEIIGHMDFTEYVIFHWTGKRPTVAEKAMINAILVTLVEHGLTPSAIAARMTYDGAPEALQGAVASGLLGVGTVFVGAVENVAEILQTEVAAWRREGGDLADRAEAVVRRYHESGRRLPGFGHPIHKPDDPRTARLFSLAREHGLYGDHCQLMELVGEAVDRQFGKHLTMNVMCALGGILSDMGYEWRIVRGFTLLSRAAGLIGHLYEEMEHPLARGLRRQAEQSVAYLPGGPEGKG